jgi:putative FmdB family regulatory protein
MPIHEYRCQECGATLELLVGIGRNSDTMQCSACGGERLERLMSAAAAVMGSAGVNNPVGSTCCGSEPGVQGCRPGSCCGAG